ncbi:calcium/proton antiporter [Salmonella enterica subsp. enterica]|uniref:Calcium/proton antiporter n=1 Tax=Salmonella enterica I TaxID=59201 RepID=A0A379VS96_SALET|nr:calcium/proton antiporter [Salmonella enterica subsp. enterica]
MTHACEAVKTRHKETSLIFPVLALVVLFLWGSSQSLPVVIWHQYPCTYWYFKQRI